MTARKRKGAAASLPRQARTEIWRQISALIPDERNARTHSPEQVAQIAASIKEFGWTNPVLVDEGGRLIAGHGRVMAATLLGDEEVPTLIVPGLSEPQRRALLIADNQLALNAGWDEDLLRSELEALHDVGGLDMDVLGFDADEIATLLGWDGGTLDPDRFDDAPAPELVEVSRLGEVWFLGPHRVMCGDSTNAEHAATLCAGAEPAALLHADPPYGMGKASDGVANDNLYAADLDRFQMAWWKAFRPMLEFNASAYVWGNAAELWRLWYVGGLGASEEFDLCNEIVWDKKSTPGMGSEANIGYQTASERCLFFKFGKQYVGNINAKDFPGHWDPLRAYMAGQAEAAGVTAPDVKRICGCGMFSHWFSRSQFSLIPLKHYESLAAACPGYFLRPWDDLQAEWARVRGDGRGVINGKLDAMRSYFDNAHDSMRDVWEFSRVTGEERHGHATPKPVAMMERVMRSSLPPGGLCLEPFGGSGSTLIGAHVSGRRCFSMEMQPQYVDVCIRRWQKLTGNAATLAGGRSFDKIAADRAKRKTPANV